MKKSQKQVSRILVAFSNLIALILVYKSVKGFRVTKIVTQIKFDGVCVKLKSKPGFPRQSFTKYLRLTLVFA